MRDIFAIFAIDLKKHKRMIKKMIIEDKRIFIVLFLYTFLLIFFCSMMSPLYPYNDWSDINLYFNIGKAMFNGKTLYTEVFDHKGPFIFFIYGIGYLISNTSFFGIYIIEAVCWTLMVFTAYFTARLYLDKIYAFIVALVFPVLMLSHTSEGGSAEEFVAVFQVISLYLFVRYFKAENASAHKPVYMLIHGLMCIMVLLIKINLVVFWFFPLLAIFINLILKKEYRNVIHNVLAFFLGVAIVALPFLIYFCANKALSEFWDIYINLNRSYAKIGNLWEVIEGLFVRFYLRLRFETFEFLIILLGAIYFPIEYIKNRLGMISIILSFIALYVAIFVTPGYVYYYSVPYYIYALLGCIVLCKFLNISSNWRVYFICTLLAFIWGINRRDFFGFTVSDLMKRTQQETIVDKISDIIGQEKNPTVLNLGLDANNGVFTRLNIVPSVKYFITPNLHYDIYPEMRNEQTLYINNKEVQFIILPEGGLNFDYFQNLSALHENYILIDKFLNSESKMLYLYKRKDK